MAKSDPNKHLTPSTILSIFKNIDITVNVQKYVGTYLRKYKIKISHSIANNFNSGRLTLVQYSV